MLRSEDDNFDEVALYAIFQGGSHFLEPMLKLCNADGDGKMCPDESFVMNDIRDSYARCDDCSPNGNNSSVIELHTGQLEFMHVNVDDFVVWSTTRRMDEQ